MKARGGNKFEIQNSKSETNSKFKAENQNDFPDANPEKPKLQALKR
jgi:hypothetical protein